MHLPRVSIMIPTYNQEKYILRAIDSALTQDYPNLDIVISDDHSPDNTQVLVENYLSKRRDSRVKYFRNSQRLGILRNYKKTLYDYASGEWAINLDGDDFFIDPTFISCAVEVAREDEAVVLVFGNYSEFYENSGKHVPILNRKLPRTMSDEDFLMLFCFDKTSWNHSSIVYQRGRAIDLGFYWDESIPRNDWESFLRLIIGKRVGHVTNVSSAWVLHEANETRKLDIGKYLNNFALIDGVTAFAVKSGLNAMRMQKWRRQMLFRSARGSCIAYVRNRDFRGAAAFLRLASKRSWTLPLRVIVNPGVLVRALLSIDPSLYTRVKALARKLTLR